MMAAIARSRPRPLDQHVFVPLRRKYNYLRVKEMLSTALGGGRGGIFGAAGGASILSGAAGGDGPEGDSRRTSIGQPGSARGPGPSGLGGAVRKASTISVGTAVAAS